MWGDQTNEKRPVTGSGEGGESKRKGNKAGCLRPAGTGSEKQDAAPLTFLTVFCKAGEEGREEERQKRRKQGEVRGDTRAELVVNPKHSNKLTVASYLHSWLCGGRTERWSETMSLWDEWRDVKTETTIKHAEDRKETKTCTENYS